jgi:ATP-dependent Clp protease ATP-binding subunit ClpB
MRLDHRIMTLQIELESLRKETDVPSRERREKLEADLKACQDEVKALTEKWEEERKIIEGVKKTKEELEKAKVELDQAQVRYPAISVAPEALFLNVQPSVEHSDYHHLG